MLLTLLGQCFYVPIMWACLTFSLLKMEVCGSKNACPLTFRITRLRQLSSFAIGKWAYEDDGGIKNKAGGVIWI